MKTGTKVCSSRSCLYGAQPANIVTTALQANISSIWLHTSMFSSLCPLFCPGKTMGMHSNEYLSHQMPDRRGLLLLPAIIWMTVHAIFVETPKDVLRAARGKNVILPCSYQTSSPNREGFIQWDKLLRSHTESVLIWKFETKEYIYGELYQNRASVSNNAEQSDASITIDQLTMDDNGTYECSVSLMSDLGGVSKSRVHLLVLVPPSKPDCGIQGETVIGNDIQLTCQSKEGSPAPQYSWKSYNVLHQERQVTPVTGQTFSLKNISTEMSGYYICISSNEVGTESCNITVAVRSPSMNVALYAGVAGGVAAALVIIGVILYCCCCRDTSKAEDAEVARPNRAAYRKPPEQLTELSRRQEEEGEDDYRHEDQRDTGRKSPDQAGR